MKISTSRFGEIEVAAEDLVTFPEGLPGFDDKRFALVPAPEAPRVVWLQAIADPELAVMTVDPKALGLDYSPRFKSGETQLIAPDGLDGTECRVIAADAGEGRVTLNLFAPLLINRGAGLAAQLPLVGSGHATGTPWPTPDASDTVPEP